MTTALHFPPYVPATLKEHYFSDVPAPVAGDDGKALTYNHGLAGYVYTSFEAAGAAASVAAAAATALATHAGATSGVHGIGSFGATLNATASQGAAQAALGLGTAALLNVGVSANNIVQLTAATKLPAVDGSLLTNLPTPSGVLLATGTTTGATSQAQTFTNGVITGKIYPPSNSTNALGLYRADGTTQDLFYNSTSGFVGIGVVPTVPLHISASLSGGSQIMKMVNTGTNGDRRLLFGMYQASTLLGDWGIELTNITVNDLYFRLFDTKPIIFYTGNSQRLQINSDGGIRLANATPSARVDGDIWYNGAHFYGRVAGADKQLDN